MILYHGDCAVVERPRLDQCPPGMDFGWGFYVTPDHALAKRWMREQSERAAILRGESSGSRQGAVTAFEFHDNVPLKILRLETGERWLRCIAAFRGGPALRDDARAVLEELERCDVVTGACPDDDANRWITLYWNGLCGETGSGETLRHALQQFDRNRLPEQYCFRTERALALLKNMGVEYHDV